MRQILITGAAGIVGTALRPWLAKEFDRLVLTDLVDVEKLEPHETFMRGDIADAELVQRLVGEVDGIVHLAGLVGPDYRFDEVLGPNVVGTYHVFEAARKHGCRIVYASSHHAVGFYERSAFIDHRAPPRPDSFYGLSKAFGESMAQYYADKHGVPSLVIRIGFVGDQAIDERRVHTWISPRDLTQLVLIGLRHPTLHHEVVYGVSDNPGPFFDNAKATRLGYVPRDRAIDHLADPGLVEQRPDPDSLPDRCVGGHFVTRREELEP